VASAIQHIDYRLWLSVIRITGTSTEFVDPYVDVGDPETTASVSIEHVADPGVAYGIDVGSEAFAGGSFELALSDDGRLVGADHSSQGAGARVVGATAKLVGTVVGAAVTTLRWGGSLASDDAASTPEPTAPDPEAAYAAACPEAASSRSNLRRAVSDLRSRLTALAVELATPSEPGSKMDRRYWALARVLTDQERQLTDANAHYEAWRASQRTERSRSYDHVVSLEEVPDDEAVARQLGSLTEEVLGAMWQPFEHLNVFVTKSSSGELPHLPSIPDSEDEAYRGFFYRRPRPVTIRRYERATASGPVVNVAREQHLIVDSTCEKRFLSFSSSAWADRNLSATIGVYGSPLTLKSSKTSTAGAIADALSGVPAAVNDGLAEAAKATEQLETAWNRRASSELARLEQRKKLADARAAADNAGLDIASLREIADLERRKNELEIRKAITELEHPPPAAGASATSTKGPVVVTIETNGA
jgi:hypothetical protein